ncbi:RNA methyltransferase [Aurantimonas sp. 22II-16-19i]|uniref:TrmH family RNA methyltransferase n=1 Tax=Aurantimonas sp. 22II-16-19i TaxID=1317114 RepID=UPI0009F7FDF9|nr:RNA methyltransferase [Aurantimonas sp. 22II-16-19i]ORE97774.1 tRNA/rRNA methyltransferase SpoU [Aurantimonas sp. 22II-16-19i]
MALTPDIAARLIQITDADDPRVADYGDIRERDRIGGGGFIAEGTVVLDHLMKSARFRPTSLFVLKSRVEGIAERLARVPGDVPVYVTDRAVMDEVAGFAIHRGVLAHGVEREASGEEAERDETGGLADLLHAAHRHGGPLVVAVGLANHDNVGAIFRNAAAFGASGVVLDATSCHPLYRKAIRVSVGTALTLPWHHGSASEAIVAALEVSGHHKVALSPRGRIDLAQFAPRPGIALLLGSEGRGLPEALLERCETVRIAMAPGIDSLNVATSAAIVLSRLYSAA